MKIGKQQQTLENTKYIHFFQNFKHIKQQQHQINTLGNNMEKALLFMMYWTSNENDTSKSIFVKLWYVLCLEQFTSFSYYYP